MIYLHEFSESIFQQRFYYFSEEEDNAEERTFEKWMLAVICGVAMAIIVVAIAIITIILHKRKQRGKVTPFCLSKC